MGARLSCYKACDNCAAECAKAETHFGDDADDEKFGGDPAGATFEETLEDLGVLDKQLMHFCATSNLAAVRWLLYLGAKWDACDTNSTTCLHVACRSGGLSVVKEMLAHRELLHAVDVAGWCPLHIAVLMGRREVVLRLLQAGALPNTRTTKGQLPLELCADGATVKVLRSYVQHFGTSPSKEWNYALDADAEEDTFGSRLQYEPFFVPRQPVLRSSASHQCKKELQKIGLQMFNRIPAYGLGFLVASGVCRDHPADMAKFLQRSHVDIKQVGSFLGESFSLAQTIRLEFFNLIILSNTGVVSALVQVCRSLRLPDDLQKINRLLHGLARVWWRKQRPEMLSDTVDKNQEGMSAAFPDELVGKDLQQHMTNLHELHQLMFSTVLLHWYVYKDGRGPRRELQYETWKKLNAGIDSGGADVADHVQRQVYERICHSFIPELVVGGYGDASNIAARETNDSGQSLLAPFASMQGWTQVVEGSFPKPPGVLAEAAPSVPYQRMSNIFSEVTSSAGFGGIVIREKSQPREEQAAVIPGRAGGDSYALGGGYSWLSLCNTLLFFTAQPWKGAPYGFVELSKVKVSAVQHEKRTLTLEGSTGDGQQADQRGHTPICIVLLLPDGRWQELCLKCLQFRFSGNDDLLKWTDHFVSATRWQEDAETNFINT